MSAAPHRVAVIGGGFGGLEAAKHLAAGAGRGDADRPPQLPPVPAADLPGGDGGAFAGRGLLSAAGDLQGAAERAGGDGDGRGGRPRASASCGCDRAPRAARSSSVDYDTLIVAAGSPYSYFGHEEWRRFAPEVKSLESALELRARLLGAFEAAELEADAERRCALLTFVVVGGGPTGVEMAGQIAELARDTLSDEFRTIDPGEARVLLVEMADRVLTAFPPSLSAQGEVAARTASG